MRRKSIITFMVLLVLVSANNSITLQAAGNPLCFSMIL